MSDFENSKWRIQDGIQISHNFVAMYISCRYVFEIAGSESELKFGLRALVIESDFSMSDFVYLNEGSKMAAKNTNTTDFQHWIPILNTIGWYLL